MDSNLAALSFANAAPEEKPIKIGKRDKTKTIIFMITPSDMFSSICDQQIIAKAAFSENPNKPDRKKAPHFGGAFVFSVIQLAINRRLQPAGTSR